MANTRLRTAPRALLAATLALAFSAGACGDDGSSTSATETDTGTETSEDPPPGAEHYVYLSPEAHLVRISMALRGIRPSVAELDAVAEDPDALPGIVDQYLDSPEFGVTIRDLHNESLLSKVDFAIPPAGFLPKGAIAGQDIYGLNVSIMESPLRLIEHVVMEDKPYSEIVTADYTLANEVVATVWGLNYGGDGPSWEQTQWPDGRGNAGILTDSWLFQRHSSTLANANRGRANAMSRALLCQDFLSRDIEIDPQVNLADANEVIDAVNENPTCVSCHQTLDPLASFFQGYFPEVLPLAEDYPIDMWVDGLFFNLYGIDLREPNYYGFGGESLRELGALMASDPRFTLCAATRFYSYFHQINLEEVPHSRAAALQELFIESDMSAKALTREIVLADAFRVSHVEPPEGEEIEWEPGLGIKKLRPYQLDAFMRDITGISWRADISQFGYGTIDLVNDGLVGFNVLAGGIDGYFVTRPSHTYNPTASLVLRAMARDASNYAVEGDYGIDDANKDQRRLLKHVALYDTDEDSIRTQLQALHLSILGERVEKDSTEVDESLMVWAAVYNDTGVHSRAWKVVVAAMLQDVKVAYY